MDWDQVEHLAFQILELREQGPRGIAAAEALLAGSEDLAEPVRELLAEVSDSGPLEAAVARGSQGGAMGGTAGAERAEPLPLPVRLGPYRLGRRLGVGGMGAVYAACDERDGGTAAVKIVRPELLGEHQSVARFAREIAITQRLRHPGVVPVLGSGEQDGMAWLAMELVSGPSLADVLRERRGDAPSARAAPGHPLIPGRTWDAACVQVALQVAEALAYAHGAGVLHRDIKPSNVVLDGAGRARLLDFGLAKDQTSPCLTGPGMLIGSLAYMAPEQAAGRPALVGPRSDLYSLGVTLAEMLTLEVPVVGGRGAQSARVLEWARRDGGALRRKLAELCAQALAPDPAQRIATAGAFAARLADCEESL